MSKEKSQDPKLPRRGWLPTRARANRLVLWYVSAATLWLVCSDWVLGMIIGYGAEVARLDVLFDWGFIALSALLLLWLTGRYFREIQNASKGLREREEQLQLFVEHSPAAIAMLDKDMRYIVVSRRWLADYGIQANDITGQSHYEIFPEIPDRWREIHRRCLAGAIERCEADPFLRADGKTDWVKWEIRPWRKDGGGIGGIIIFSELITERKLAEEALNRSEQNYRQIFNAVEDAIYVHELETGRVLDVNDAMLRMHGYASKEECLADGFEKILLGEAPYDLVEAQRRIRLAIEEGPQVFEWKNRRRDGSVFWAEISLRCSKIGGQERVLAIGRDVTLRKEQQREIERFSRLYLTLSHINQSVVKCRSRAELFQSICQVMVEFGKFKMARIDESTSPKGEVSPSVHYSQNGGANGSQASWSAVCEVCHESIQNAQPILCNEAKDDPRTSCCRQVLRYLGIESCAAFPLQSQGRTVATLGICSGEPNFFRAEENRVLEEIASDISYALDQLEEQERRRQVEAALSSSEALLRMMGHTAKVGGWELDPVTGEGTWTDEVAKIHDLGPATKLNKDLGLSHYHGTSRTQIEAAVQAAIQQGTPYDLELEIVSAKGAHKWIRTICHPELKDGKVVKLRGSVQDITRRKQNEALRDRQQRRLALLADISRQLVITDTSIQLLDGIFQSIASEMDVDIFANYMVTPAGDRLSLQSSAGLTEQQVRDFTELPFGTSLCGVVAETKQSHVFADLPSAAPPQSEGIVGLGVRAYAGFPLIANDRLIGTISFGSRRRARYEDDDVQLMRAVADQVAAAVERNRLLDAVRASEERFRAYVEQAADGMFVHDESGRFLEVNSQACLSLGYTREELLGMSVLDISEHTEAEAEVFWARVKPGKCLTLQDHHRRKDGTRFPVEIRTGCFEMGGKRHVLGLARDTSERQRSDEEIRRQAGLIKSLIDSIPDLIFFKNVDGIYLGCNPAFADLTGRTREDITGKNDHDLFPKEAADFFRQQDREMLKGLKPRQNEEWVDYPDGRRVLLDTLKTPYWGPDGSLLGVLGISRDVTIRKEAEAKLRESDQRFRALVEAAPEAILVRTGEHFVYVNHAAMRLFGATSMDQILGQRVMDRFHPKSRPEVAKMIERLDAEGESVIEIDRELMRLDGTSMEASISAVAITFQGKPSALVFARDISDRKRAEAALWQQFELRNQLAKTAATVPGIIYSFRLSPDRTMSMPYASPAIEGVFGITPEEVRTDASPILGLIHPADANRINESIMESARTLKPWHEEFRAKGKRGEIWVEGQSVPQFGADGSILWHGFLHDITDRKLADERLRKLSRAVEQSPVSVVITDFAGHIEYANPKFTELTGYTLAEARGKSPRILKSGNTSAEEYRQLWKSIRQGETWRGEFLNRKKNGEKFWEVATISPITDEAGRITHFLAVKEDITAHKQLESQLRQSQKLEAIGQLAGGVAHDFNNILAAMMMQAELSALTPNIPEEVREGLDQIRTATERAASLTRQLLLFSRKQVLQPKDLDLNEVVTSLAKMLQRIIREDVRLQLHLHPAPLVTHADAGMLDQVLMNLAVNARDAMPDGGNLLIETAEVTITAEAARANPDATAGRYVSLSVTDSGCGMTADVMTRIFEPFFTTKEPGKGTGLGLATVFGIVKQHRGWVEVRSELGKGATFQVFLPAINGTTTAKANTTLPVFSRGVETILLVEDDGSVRRMTRTLLERQGYKVIDAANGVKALKVWKQNRQAVSLLLTDLVMPAGLTGQQLARELQADKPDLRVVFTSGYSAEIAGGTIHLRSGENFIQKPCAPAQLLDTIRKTLDG